MFDLYTANYQLASYVYHRLIERFGKRLFRFTPDYANKPDTEWTIEYRAEITEELSAFITQVETEYPYDIDSIANYNYYCQRAKEKNTYFGTKLLLPMGWD